MKIYNASNISKEYLYSTEEEQQINEFINKSKSKHNLKLSFLKIEDNAGWTYLTAKINESKFLIKYSSCMSDTSQLIKFFAQMINLKEDITLFLDYEGSYPLLYVSPINKDEVRFIFAHDYELFLNKEIDSYNINDYKIECDIIIDKKLLLNEFYNIFSPFTINYNLEKTYEPAFHIKRGKKYLVEIEKYLKQ